MKDDTYYREMLAVQNDQLRLLRNIANAQKHVHLVRGNPAVDRAGQVVSRTIGWGEGGYGLGRFGGVQQVVVDLAPDEFAYVEAVIDDALAFLMTEMALLGA